MNPKQFGQIEYNNSMMVNLNPNILIITLSINGLDYTHQLKGWDSQPG